MSKLQASAVKNDTQVNSEQPVLPRTDAVDNRGWHITADPHLAFNFRGRIGKSEFIKGTDGAEQEIFHVSLGWRDPGLADLKGVAAAISKRDNIFRPVGAEFIEGLKSFEAFLDREWTLAELREISPLLREFKLDLKRDGFRFFFITSFMNEGSLMITVFLEATPAELLSRPPHYENADKNLFTTYFTEDGMLRRTEAEFHSEEHLTKTVESTAYAKFYLDTRDDSASGIDILIHPMQRARLVHSPARDSCFAGYHKHLRDLGGLFKKRIGAWQHQPNPPPEDERRVLGDIAETLIQLSQHVQKRDFLELSPVLRERLVYLLKKLPRRECYERAPLRVVPHEPPHDLDSDKVRDRKSNSYHRLIRAAINRTIQVENILRKGAARTEAPYLAADQITGSNRELLFLAVSELLQNALKTAIKKPVERFMLSSEQIERVRLFRESDQIRERIKEVPLQLEKRCKVDTLERFLVIAPKSEREPTPKEATLTPISVICLDEIRGSQVQVTPSLV